MTNPACIKLTYIGHSTNLIEMDGIRILTDPLLRDQVLHLRRTDSLANADAHQSIDAVLISHLHHDHCDLPSLRMLDKKVRMLVPKGASGSFAKWKFQNVEEIAVDQIAQIGSVSVTATLAKHSGYRPPFGPEAQTVGYVIRGGGSVYFAGDTDIFPEMEKLPRDLDLALLPVWGWGPTLGAGHLNPYEAARALKLIQPKMAVPIHWGTFSPIGLKRLNLSFLTAPPLEFAQHAHEMAPDVDVKILQPGESLEIG